MKRPPLTIELGLLGYLRAGPQHGYQVHQQLQKAEGPGLVWRVKQAQLYARLGKLEEAGYIQSSLQGEETRPTRRVYQLTKKGQDVFDQWLVAPISAPRRIRQEFLVKLYFAQGETPQTMIKLIDNQLSVCQGWLERYQQQLAQASKGSYGWVVHQYRVGQIQATLAWLKRLKTGGSKKSHPQ